MEFNPLDAATPDTPLGSSQSLLGWVPIRSLAPRHRPRIAEHLLGLPERDRYLRFGHHVSDAQIQRYADDLDFDRDEIFGVFNRRLQVAAMAHLAYLPPRGCGVAEFGVSVAPRLRGRGLGARLFDHAILHARNRQVDTLIVHALSENTAMLRIALAAGARVQRAGQETEAVLKLPQEDVSSHLEALLGVQVAEVDYGIKVNARRAARLLDFFGDPRHAAVPPTRVEPPTDHRPSKG